MSVYYNSDKNSSEAKKQRKRQSISGIVNFIRKRRAQIGEKVGFNPNEDFADMDNINRGEFALTPTQLEFFYPSSKNQTNWGYENDHMSIAAESDKKFLRQNFPVVKPDFDTYFEEREKIALRDNNFPLRFPALFYLSMPQKNYNLT